MIYATLVHGGQYAVRSMRHTFVQGEAVAVSPDQRTYLEHTAVVHVHGHPQCRFSFTTDEAAPPPSPAPSPPSGGLDEEDEEDEEALGGGAVFVQAGIDGPHDEES